MVRNYSKEARISKVNAESIIRRAMFVTLLYSVASAFLLSFVWLFVMEIVDFHGFTKVAEDPSTHTLILMQAINDLTGTMSNILGDLIVFSVPAICIIYIVLKIIFFFPNLGNVENSVKNPHLVANKSNLKSKKRVCKLFIKEARRIKDKGKLYAAKRRLKEVKKKEKEVVRFYRFNRYAKNAQTETVYRYWVERVEKCGKFFFTLFRLIATVFFAYMLVKSTGLIEYVKDLSTFDEINTKKPLPSIFDALTPTITFGESAKDTLYLQWVYIALIVGLVFQFIAGPISGKITRVRLANHEITYLHTKSIGWVDQVDYNHSYYNLNRNIHSSKLHYLDELSDYDEYSAQPKMLGGSYSSELQPYYAGYASIPRRWDDSDAILEERGREFGVGLFFIRNFIQVVCTFLLVGIFVYLFPALEQIELMEQRNLMGVSFGTIFAVLKWIIILHLVRIIWYTLSAKEYDFDVMHEETEHRRKVFGGTLAWLSIWIAIYFVLLFIPEVVESAEGQLYSIKTLFDIAVPNNDPTATGAFVPVFNKIVSTFVFFFLVAFGGCLGQVFVFVPREKKKKVKEGDDFFAVSRSWRNISLDEDDE